MLFLPVRAIFLERRCYQEACPNPGVIPMNRCWRRILILFFWFVDLIGKGRTMEAVAGVAAVTAGWLILTRRTLGSWGFPAMAFVFAAAWFIVESIR